MSESGKAVFLSYASQDAEAARRICDALRAAGVEVWFDQNELVGGDAWDTKIRRQIKECALFVPIISASTQARLEGYFRIEWKLAAQRTHAMAVAKAFLLPVVIDDTRDAEAHVPEEFLSVQWSRLAPSPSLRSTGRQAHAGQARQGGDTCDEALGAFCARIQKLLGGSPLEVGRPSGGIGWAKEDRPAMRGGGTPPTRPRSRRWLIPAIAGLGAAVALVIWQPWKSAGGAAGASGVPTAARPGPETAASLAAKAFEQYYPFCTPGRLELANEFSRRATELDPNYARGWGARAGASARYLLRDWVSGESARQRARDAQSFATRALSLDKNETEALLALGIVAWHQKASGQAETLFRRVLTVEPGNAQALTLLSRVAREGGRFSEAVGLMKRAAEKAPRDPMVWLYLGFAYFDGWNFRKASEQFGMAAQVTDFQGARAYQAWADFFLTGDVPRMRAALDQLDLVYAEDDGKLAMNLVCALFERRTDRVVEIAGRTASAYIDDWWTPKAWFLALAYESDRKDNLARQQWQAAEAVVRERLRADPQDETLRVNLAITLAKLGRADEARADLKVVEAAWREQLTPIRARRLARFHAASGNAAVAVAWLRQCVNRPTFLDENETTRTLQLDPWWDGIRGSEEFRALLANPPPAPIPVDESESPAVHANAGLAPEKSIAVLPFVQIGAEPDNAAFADGVHLDVILALQKIRDLKVIQHTSVLAFRDPSQRNLRRIASELGVATILEGTVRRSGSQLRVTAELSEASTGRQLWSETYNKELKEVFAIQTELAVAIVTALKATLLPQERTVLERRPTANLRAYELYVAAREKSLAMRDENAALAAWEAVVRELEQALAGDPGFAAAQAQLALTHARIYTNPRLDQSPARKELARQAVAAAERLAPDAPETLLAAAYYAHACDYDYARAGGLFAAAVERAPGDSEALALFSLNHRRLGHFGEAVDTLAKAMALDPASAALRWPSYQHALFYLRRYADAAAGGERQIALLPALAGSSAFGRYTAIARFEVDGDRDRFAARLRDLPEDAANPGRIVGRYLAALCSGDLTAAARVLDDPRIPPTAQFEIDTNPLNPIGMERALVAYLQGNLKLAAEHVASVADYIRHGNWTGNVHWNSRSQLVRIAAFTGHKTEALRLAQELRRDIAGKDSQTELGELTRLGRTYALLGERDEALAILRALLTGPSVTSFAGSPRLMRLDPCWSKLADDPRFEAILKAAKPL